ncbi:hypothetical protein DUI87_12597 [Hirundo rustica rustica]|uniref:Uncharacterized protein n=1 Tax=Hirundo rustica rustica TaxID=333673 RepID=A0A3M0KI00_HIRRU|nr:hypothetical protein DUI87_12597 [Hirundo rustica rustica]
MPGAVGKNSSLMPLAAPEAAAGHSGHSQQSRAAVLQPKAPHLCVPQVVTEAEVTISDYSDFEKKKLEEERKREKEERRRGEERRGEEERMRRGVGREERRGEEREERGEENGVMRRVRREEKRGGRGRL